MTGIFDMQTMLGGTPTTQQIQQIPCDMLVPYHNHPFELYSDERLDDMVQSIKDNGVLSPIIVQPIDDGKYEILIGHNRWNASTIAGKDTVPAIVKNGLTEDEAEMYVIESNLMQRGFDNLKISEQAAVVASRYQKMFSQGKRNDIINEIRQFENVDTEQAKKVKTDSRSDVGKEYGLGRTTVARLIRVDTLTDNLKAKVDEGIISIRAGVELSYLNEECQDTVADLTLHYKIDAKKAAALRRFSNEADGNIDENDVIDFIEENEQPSSSKPKKTYKLRDTTISKFFAKDLKEDVVNDIIEKALELYWKHINTPTDTDNDEEEIKLENW